MFYFTCFRMLHTPVLLLSCLQTAWCLAAAFTLVSASMQPDASLDCAGSVAASGISQEPITALQIIGSSISLLTGHHVATAHVKVSVLYENILSFVSGSM